MITGRVVIAGVSTRAAADSAARAGFEVTAIDAFADLDHHPSVRAAAVRPFSAAAAARAARPIECDAAVYLSNFENHPDAVQELSAGRELWGNPPDVLRRARDPLCLMRALRHRGIATPSVRMPRPHHAQRRAPPERTQGVTDRRKWLMKPLASGGGHGVGVWDRDAPIPDGCYAQEFVDGWPGSIVFVAANRRAVPLGVCRQLIGDLAFGATGYRYCGSILQSSILGDELVEAAVRAAAAAAEEFDLIGINGLDFIAHDGVPYIIEVNPRWTASAELVERACGMSVFSAHAEVFARHSLPSFDWIHARRVKDAVGKAIVFARQDVTIADTMPWLDDDTVRDVPHCGDEIRAGRPICTVFGSGASNAACYEALVRRAEMVYAAPAVMASVHDGRMRENQ